MRAASPHTPPTRIGWTWVVCAESRRAGRRRSAAGGRPTPGLDEGSATLEWERWLLAAPHINENRSIQAAARDGRSLAQWIRSLCENTHPVTWTLGLGFGQLFASKRPDGKRMFEGPAVDRARSALWRARQQKRGACVVGIGEVEADALASMLDLIGEIRRRWTARQAQIVSMARARNGRQVADELGIGPSVVSESLSAASFRPLLRAEESVAGLLDRYGGRTIDLGTSSAEFPPLITRATDPQALEEGALA